jgi:sugar lactone lactonase YvrE
MRMLGAVLLAAVTTTLPAQTLRVRTIAGPITGGGYVDGTGTNARFSGPTNAVACGGAVFVADTGNHAIRRISHEGVVTTWAGVLTEEGSADGDRTAARFRFPAGIAADAQCNLFVADMGNHTIRRIAASGAVTTLAGAAGSAGLVNSANPLLARFDAPHDVAVDGSGRVWVADTNNKTVRVIAANGAVTTVAGGFTEPRGIAIDGSGNALVANFSTSGTVVRLALTGERTTVTSTKGAYYDAVATADGTVYAVDYYSAVVVRVEPNGGVTTVAGARDKSGYVDGSGGDARFYQISGLALDEDGTLLVIERLNCDVRRVTVAGQVTTVAGSGPQWNDVADGSASAARFNGIGDIDVDADGVVYVGSRGTVRRIARDGTTTTLAGSATESAHRDGTGGEARFTGVAGLVVASNGDLIVADGQTIRRVTQAGVVTTIAGQAGKPGLVDGIGDAARFNNPFSVGIAPDGTIYVCDTINTAIRKVVVNESGNVVTTFHRDTAGLNLPTDLEVDAAGNVYFWDENISSLFRLTPDGTRTTLAHEPMLYAYHGLAVAPDGTMYVGGGNSHSHAILRLSPGSSTLEVFAGAIFSPGNQNGEPLAARFFSPSVLTVAPNGRLYVADGNAAVRSFVTGDPPSIASFTASAGSVRAGESVTLTWVTSGGAGARIEPQVGAVAFTGSTVVQPASTTRYKLIVSNDAGDESATTLVVVPRRSRAVPHP